MKLDFELIAATMAKKRAARDAKIGRLVRNLTDQEVRVAFASAVRQGLCIDLSPDSQRQLDIDEMQVILANILTKEQA